MKKWMIFAAVVGVAVLALGAASLSFAQTADRTDTATPLEMLQKRAQGFNPRDRGQGFQSQLRTYMESAIETVFGLTPEEQQANREAGISLLDYAASQGMAVEEFQAAMESVREHAIEAAVADGTITQEQAAAMAVRQQARNLFNRGDGAVLAEYMHAAIAEAFGITVEELEAAKDSGQSLMDLAAEKGWTVEQFQDTFQGARTQAIDDALADGAITEEQADFLREHSGKRGPGSFGGFSGPGGRGGGHGPRGGGECPEGGQFAPPAADSGTSW